MLDTISCPMGKLLTDCSLTRVSWGSARSRISVYQQLRAGLLGLGPIRKTVRQLSPPVVWLYQDSVYHVCHLKISDRLHKSRRERMLEPRPRLCPHKTVNSLEDRLYVIPSCDSGKYHYLISPKVTKALIFTACAPHCARHTQNGF